MLVTVCVLCSGGSGLSSVLLQCVSCALVVVFFSSVLVTVCVLCSGVSDLSGVVVPVYALCSGVSGLTSVFLML